MSIGGIAFGGQMNVCNGFPALPFPLTRYSVADIDGSLELVFGKGSPRLAETWLERDAGYERALSPRFVTALLAVARARVKAAASEAASLVVCEKAGQIAETCVQNWLQRYGDQLYRRPLTQEQIEAYSVPFIGVQTEAARVEVAENVLAAMVLSPYFVLRVEVSAASGIISAHDVASRLAYLATRRIPDAPLRALAESEQLFDPIVRLAELHRLWQTPAGRAARELQLLEWLDVASAPDEPLEPALADDMRAQARAFISQVYDEQDGAFSAFFSSARLPLNDRLAQHYGLPLPGTEQLEPLELDQHLFGGLLSSGAFLTRYPGPTQRGIAILSSLLCVDVPLPPTGHEVLPPPVGETPRLAIRAAVGAEPQCITCHDTFDPVGFALDAFDDQGRLTGFATYGSLTTSPGTPAIIVSGPAALGDAATRSPAARDCLARRSLEHALQRKMPAGYVSRVLPPPNEPESSWLSCLASATNARPPSLTALMETIVAGELLVARSGSSRRVVAFDTHAEPVDHAYQETQQLRGAYAEEDGGPVIERYAEALRQALAGSEPVGGAGAGAGGDSGAGGAP